MVKKLIKYDFMSFFRLLFPVQLIIIGIAVVNRLIQLFESYHDGTYQIVFTSSVVLLVIACIVAFVMCFIIAVVRFYQGLYSNEGYLSHTLPVSAAQHIWSKLLVSLIFELGTILAIWIAVNVATLGEVGAELYKAGGYLLGQLFSQVHGHLILFILEGIVLFLVVSAAAHLLVYFCISVGQLASKKKVLLAFGVYFGIYVLVQILFTLFIILGSALMKQESWIRFLENLSNWIKANPVASVHIGVLSAIVVNGVIALVCFLVSRAIMTRRLNLS